VRLAPLALAGLALISAAACDDMESQPRQRAYTPKVGPADVPRGTVEFQARVPEAPPITLGLIERGQDRYRVYCAPCHSELGDGRGMIVQRGFPAPPSFRGAPVRDASPQQLYEAISNGFGVMYPFADRVSPGDRWAIVAYIRALERSQDALPSDMASAGGAP
jgi:mono/diheme cytochrome c family protein